MEILIVENNFISRCQLEDIFKKWGFEVNSCSDCNVAWEMIDKKNPPGIVVLDWRKSSMEGIRLCQRIRNEISESYVYILLLTMEENVEDRLLGLDTGADNYLDRPFNAIMLKSQLEVAERIIHSQSELISSMEFHRAMAARDSLTGLWNHSEIIDILDREMGRAGRGKNPVSAVMIDLDNFKEINDNHGHTVGDTVLCEVAKRMSSAIRQYDSVGRYGGEEFLVVLPGCDQKTIGFVTEKLRKIVYEDKVPHPEKENTVIPVTASIGVAVCCNPEKKDAKALIQLADSALYQAKENGRNRVEMALLP